MSQTDEKGWKAFVESVQKAVKSLVSPKKPEKKPSKKQSAEDMRGFAALLGKTIKQRVIKP